MSVIGVESRNDRIVRIIDLRTYRFEEGHIILFVVKLLAKLIFM